MTRQPHLPLQRKGRSSKSQIITFSSFARILARLQTKHTSSSRARSKILKSLGSLPSKEKIKQLESSADDDTEDIVQADFVFFDPKPDDFHGVKILLRSYLDNEQWDLSGFTDLIVGQTSVGTVVKIDSEEDDGLLSFITVLNFERYKDHRCISEVKKYLLKVCQEKNTKSNLDLLLGEKAKDVGLLVSQRVVNLPLQLLPPQYDALFDEISWATEDEPTAELREFFRLKFYLVITKIYKNKHSEQVKRTSKGQCSEPILYIKPEDELFHKHCVWSFTYPLCTQEASTHELRSYRLMGLVMIVSEENIPAFRKELKSLVTESEG